LRHESPDLAWGIGGLVTPAVALAGFSTPSWFMALGALALAAAMLRSGLLLRIALWLLRMFPATHSGQMLALLASGVLITPLMPLALARTAAIAPLTQKLAET
jgi:di/tricarboxylate transporter